MAGRIARRARKFSSFLHTVFTARFCDYVKHLRRERSHYVCLAPDVIDSEAWSRDEHSIPAHRSSRDDPQADDPAVAAERSEFMAALDRVIESLDPISRKIWELRMYCLS